MNLRKRFNKFKIFVFIIITVVIIFNNSCDNEKKNWNKTKAEGSIYAYKDYIKKYPTGDYVNEAHKLIERFHFENAIEKNNISYYDNFLKHYPEGILSGKVKSKLESLYYEKALLSFTIPAFENFIKKYNQGTLSEKARDRIKQILNQRHRVFKKTRVVKIIINQSYGKAKDVMLPFYNIAKNILKYAGLEVLDSDDKNCDVILKINVSGKAKGKHYVLTKRKINPLENIHVPLPTSRRSSYLYTGANLSGNILFEIPGTISFKRTFKGEIKNPKEISRFNYGHSPSHAPFSAALDISGFSKKLLKIMEEVYGPSVLISALNSGNNDVRFFPAFALGKIGKSDMIPFLAAIKHGSYDVKKRAVEILDRMEWHPENEDEKIVYLIASRQWKKCALMGKPAIIPLISQLNYLEKYYKQTRNSSVLYAKKEVKKAIVLLGDNAIKPLVALLNSEVARDAVEVLKDLKWIPENNVQKAHYLLITGQLDECEKIGEDAVNPLIDILNGRNSDLRRRAIWVLGRIKDIKAAPSLIHALNDRDFTIRMGLVKAMGNIKDSRFVEPLRILLEDKNTQVRIEASRALWKINRDSNVSEVLITALEHKSKIVQCQAASVLGEIDLPKAITHLQILLNDKASNIRQYAASKLVRIKKDEKAVKILINALNSNDFMSLTPAINALSYLKETRAIGPLIEAFKEQTLRKQREGSFLMDPYESRYKGGILFFFHSALVKITGQDLGSDYKAWSLWWKRNKE